jgi:hypothetical protein
MKSKFSLISLIVILSLSLGACNYPGRETPTSQIDVLNTAAAQTIQAQQTQIAETSQANAQLTLTATLNPENTETPEPEVTRTPTPTTTSQAKCDQVGFVSETIPDGTKYNPGQSFTKTWTLKNTGSCTWSSGYDIVFVSGTAMNAPASKQLTTGTVAPGQSIQISLELEAPNAAGTHRGNFKLRNGNGVIFGIGEKDSLFWVEIDVAGTLYDFTKNYCASGVKWTSAAGELPCPGTPGDVEGWVKVIDPPTLENGVVDDEPGLVVHPQMVNDGWIRGTFPPITVTGGVNFKVIVGCHGSADCNVKFKLNYKIDGGEEQTLATWHEVQDSKHRRVTLDLSSLAGKKVQFILLVEANGSSANDEVLWFGPRIEP